MDTTPADEITGGDSVPADLEHEAELASLASSDPADAPEPAERLAGDLARELEGVSADGEPQQLEAPFTADTRETS